MLRRAQAIEAVTTARRSIRGWVLLGSALALSACASGNILAKAETDKTITGSIPASAMQTPASQIASDVGTIRNAVSSADLNQVGKIGISWANPSTGSSGLISEVTQQKDQDILCRRFTTTRQSFDGIAIYHGEACLGETGEWSMLRLDAS